MSSTKEIKMSTRELIESAINDMSDAGCRMTISGVAKEASVSNATIHNRYPDLASKIRELQEKPRNLTANNIPIIRQEKITKLNEQQKILRNELIKLKERLNISRSINATLDQEVQLLKAENIGLKKQLSGK